MDDDQVGNATSGLLKIRSDHDRIKVVLSPNQRGNPCQSPRPRKSPQRKPPQRRLQAQPTVTLKHLAAALADSHDIAKKQAEAVLGDLVTLTTRHLKRGDKIRLTGLGILQVRKRAARMGGKRDRRNHQDQGEQEGRVPGCQGTERGGVAGLFWGQQSPGPQMSQPGAAQSPEGRWRTVCLSAMTRRYETKLFRTNSANLR